MSRLAPKLICCVVMFLAVGARQFASGAPMVVCYFDNCFDAGANRQEFSRSDVSTVAATGLGSQFRQVAISPFTREDVVRSIGEGLTTNTVTETLESPVTASQRAFSVTAAVTSVPNVSTANSEGSGANFTLNAPVALPEPTTMLLLGAGLAGLAMKARKRRQ